ncbi:class I adenylate-forming enzyme family protein [Hymenobacter guriensis]|uniref:Acyl--CoA ligase n=1 Tax=Hymenobacter guriensis TaxID=2793065 RepID=A0ABS0L753_9BACT|nr:class I adenylate-forming enzyme family protein [Hymenobacter guriensis]MBG8555985.1 acyl--CoA ligase [Hymenobacter guriensis]
MIHPSALNPDTIPEMLCHRARYSPRDVAFCFPELQQSCTWEQLWAGVRLLAGALHRLGIQKGDRVAVLMEGSPELIQTLLAIVAVGAVAVPINAYSKNEELKAYCLDARPVALLLGTGPKLLPSAELATEAQATPGFSIWLPPHVFVQGPPEEVPSPFRTLSDLLKTENQLPDESLLTLFRASYTQEPAFLLYTSGTTGQPKGVLRTTASFLIAKQTNRSGLGGWLKARITRLSDQLTNRFTALVMLPLYHLGGIGLLFTALKVSNVRVVMLTRFNPVRALQSAAQEKCQFLIGTPFMVQAMLTSPLAHTTPLMSVLGIAFTSAAVNGPMLEKILAKLPQLYFFTVSYGSSEAGAVANGTCLVTKQGNLWVNLFLKLLRGMNLLNGFIAYEEFQATPHSICGPIDKHVQVRVADLHTGEVLPPDQPGEIQLRSHRVMRYAQTSITQESFLPEGWFKSGDIGYISPKGYLIISDRLKRLISRGGEKISPVEVENALLQHPGVAEAFVVGIPDELYGEQVCAAIIVQPGASVSAAQIQADLATRLSQFKVPKYVVPLTEFPLSGSGKISSESIKQLVLEQIKHD